MRKLFAILAAGALLVSGTAQAAPVVTTASLSVSIQALLMLSGTTLIRASLCLRDI